MRKFTVNLLSLSLGLALMPLAQAVNSPQQQQLLEQVRLGESTQREDGISARPSDKLSRFTVNLRIPGPNPVLIHLLW